MPKIKTNRSAAKRFTVKKSGKVRYKKGNLRHLLTLRGTGRKKHARATGHLGPVSAKIVKKSLPNG